MQRINNEKERRVTGKIIGIIKPMNKTYGGSILKYHDQFKQTREKFDKFIANMNISQEEIDQYRVFVPFNI